MARRLTTAVNTIKEDVDIQQVVDALAAYEIAEAEGSLIKPVKEAYCFTEGTILKGRVLEIKCVPSDTGFAIDYSLMVSHNLGIPERLFQGSLGVDVFNTKEEAEDKCFNSIRIDYL